MESDLANITLALESNAKSIPNKKAIILPDSFIDYKTLNNLVWSASTYFYNIGIREGDIVGLNSDKELLRIITMLALLRLGAVFFPIPHQYSLFQIHQTLNEVKINFLITNLKVELDLLNVITIDMTNLVGNEINYGISSLNLDNPCLMISGSGSTGKKKIICLTHRQMIERSKIAFSEYTHDLNVYSFTSLEFFAGINRFISTIMHSGAFCLISNNKIDHYAKIKNISILFCSVFHAEKLINLYSSNNKPAFPFLDAIRVSGSSVSNDLRNKIRYFLNQNLQIVYGANECGRITMLCSSEKSQDDFSVGSPLEGVEIKIIDSEGNHVSTGQKGQILVRSPSMIYSYYNNLEESKKNFKGGWFYTNDLGQISDKGQLRHFGRIDNLIIYNGINIFPVEIEETIKGITGVRDVAIVGFPNQYHGQVPVGLVEIFEDNFSNIESLKSEIKDKLGFKSPQKLFYVKKIPRDENGKISHNLVVEYLKKLER